MISVTTRSQPGGAGKCSIQQTDLRPGGTWVLYSSKAAVCVCVRSVNGGAEVQKNGSIEQRVFQHSDHHLFVFETK